MANNFYNRNSSFNPDELADGDAIEAEFDAVARGFGTIKDLVNANQAGYPEQTFHVAPATLDTHAVPKAQMETALSFKLDAVNYSAADILSKLKTVDGTDSGLDADYLDGQHGSYYRNADNINAGTLAKERLPGTIDSSTTGTAANAELLDGLDSTRFSRSAVGQLNNYDNWDAFTAHGTYKVHSPDFAGNANAPPSTYGYGILQVEVSEIGGENLTNQVYYPHNNDYDKYIYQRMLNGGIWTAWSKIWRGGTGPKSGLQASKVYDIAPIGDGCNLVDGEMAGDDFFRLRVYSDVYDGGAVELATADGGNEPIYVRQYDGIFSSVRRTLTLLDGYGNTSIPGLVRAAGYKMSSTNEGVHPGNGDGCNQWTNNLKLESLYGIGFSPNISGQPVPYGEYSHWFNTRNGDMGCRGTITASFFNGRAYPVKHNGEAINFRWVGQAGQPPWLWGGSDGVNMYVYNPYNFSVNYANSAGSANTVTNNVAVLSGIIGHNGWLPIPDGFQEWQCRFFISMNNTNPNENTWDLRENISAQHYSEYCRLINNRQVEVFTRVYNDVIDTIQYHVCIANYIVIGVK